MILKFSHNAMWILLWVPNKINSFKFEWFILHGEFPDDGNGHHRNMSEYGPSMWELQNHACPLKKTKMPYLVTRLTKFSTKSYIYIILRVNTFPCNCRSKKCRPVRGTCHDDAVNTCLCKQILLTENDSGINETISGIYEAISQSPRSTTKILMNYNLFIAARH